jgi:hypothetical protein
VIACQQVMSPRLVQGGFEATGDWGMHGLDLDARLRASSYQNFIGETRIAKSCSYHASSGAYQRDPA